MLSRRSVGVCVGRTTLSATVIFEVPREAARHFRAVCRFMLASSPLRDVADIEALLPPLPKTGTSNVAGTVSITRQARLPPRHTPGAEVGAGANAHKMD